MTDHAGSLQGLRILVVEDVVLVAEVICDELEYCGCTIVGPVTRLQPAVALARNEALLDGAVLDLRLDGELSFPVCAVLRERGIPFVFLTGYDDGAVFPPEYERVPRLQKPLRGPEFIAFVTAHLIPTSGP
jgi:CheY-like chemotaxis protein